MMGSNSIRVSLSIFWIMFPFFLLGQLGYERLYVMSVYDENGERLLFEKENHKTSIKGRGNGYSQKTWMDSSDARILGIKPDTSEKTLFYGPVSWIRPVNNVVIEHEEEKMKLVLQKTDSIPKELALALINLRFQAGKYKIDCSHFYRHESQKQGESFNSNGCGGYCLDITPDSLRYTPDTTRKK